MVTHTYTTHAHTFTQYIIHIMHVHLCISPSSFLFTIVSTHRHPLLHTKGNLETDIHTKQKRKKNDDDADDENDEEGEGEGEEENEE